MAKRIHPLGEEGLARAEAKNDKSNRDWADMADGLARRMLRRRRPGDEFSAELIKRWCYDRGLPEPTSASVWGGVILRLRAEGRIRFAGFGRPVGASAHGRPVRLWVRVK